MAVGFGNWSMWRSGHGRPEVARPRAPAAPPAYEDDSVYVIAGRATPLLTSMAAYAPNLCAMFTEHNDVMLEGYARERMPVAKVAAEIAALPGVRHVYNWLYTDEQIADLIGAALALDDRTTWDMINVSSDHGVITLRGVVASAAVRAAAEEIAWHAPFVHRVQNQLVVQATPAPVLEEEHALSSPVERRAHRTPADRRLASERRTFVAY